MKEQREYFTFTTVENENVSAYQEKAESLFSFA